MKIIVCKKDYESTGGFVVPLCGLLLVVFFSMASFVIDIGNSRYQLRNIQVVSDACSYAALLALGPTTNYTAVRNQVINIANLNGVAQAEIAKIDCGTWSAGAFTSQGMNAGVPICNSSTNAVQVSIARQVNTFFGRILGTAHITPATLAVSSVTPLLQCMTPFGIKKTIVDDLEEGEDFSVGKATTGNWGKLFVGVSKNPYVLVSETCNQKVKLNSSTEVITGFNDLGQFDDIIGDTIVVALTTDFPTGTSGNVDILEFVKVQFLGSNKNGANWAGNFRLVERGVLPNPDPNQSTRKLVK